MSGGVYQLENKKTRLRALPSGTRPSFSKNGKLWVGGKNIMAHLKQRVGWNPIEMRPVLMYELYKDCDIIEYHLDYAGAKNIEAFMEEYEKNKV